MDNIIFMAFQVVTLVIVVDAVLSWVQAPSAFPRSLTSTMTEPLYAPIRAILSPQATGGIDFSPLIVLMGLQFLSNFLIGIL